MAQATGADPVVFNAERVLRFAGFTNTKYEEQPRAKLLKITGKRYSSDELAEVLPTDPVHRESGTPGREPPTRKPMECDPHAGGDDVPQIMTDELTTSLLAQGARWYGDGRLSAPCPFPHREGSCDCTQAFYFSPTSGRWWCFCSQTDWGRLA